LPSTTGTTLATPGDATPTSAASTAPATTTTRTTAHAINTGASCRLTGVTPADFNGTHFSNVIASLVNKMSEMHILTTADVQVQEVRAGSIIVAFDITPNSSVAGEAGCALVNVLADNSLAEALAAGDAAFSNSSVTDAEVTLCADACRELCGKAAGSSNSKDRLGGLGTASFTALVVFCCLCAIVLLVLAAASVRRRRQNGSGKGRVGPRTTVENDYHLGDNVSPTGFVTNRVFAPDEVTSAYLKVLPEEYNGTDDDLLEGVSLDAFE